ncbi:MAG: DNA-processing protein DprA [Polyangiaceae bacterium]
MSQHFVQILTGNKIPHWVSDLPHPPEILHLVGALPRGPSIAVVGTRHPTEEAVAFTSTLVSGLATAGYSIWSGGAEGIDAAAHRAALRCGAKTVVVAPAGWLRPYPEQHAELYREIVDSGGGYLSLVEAECVAHRHHFFARNALLVAFTQALVVVQAGFRSGARNAAKTARRLGRPVFAAPSCPWVPQGAGCNVELALGARPFGSAKEILRHLSSVLGWSAAATFPDADDDDAHANEPTKGLLFEPDVVAPSGEKASEAARRERGSSQPVARRCHDGPTQSNPRSARHEHGNRVASNPTLDAELNTLLVVLAGGARSIDELCQRTGWPAAVVQSDVLRLTLQGRVRMGRSGAIEIVSD